MQNDTIIDHYVRTHPKESLRYFIFLCFFIWQSTVALLAVPGYFLLARFIKIHPLLLFFAGTMIALGNLLLNGSLDNLSTTIINAQHLNFLIWKSILGGYESHAMYLIMHDGLDIVMGFTFFAIGCIALSNLLPTSVHHAAMQALHKGEHLGAQTEITNQEALELIKQYEHHAFDGTLLGVSKYHGTPVVIPDQDINQIALVLGTTGGGKTVTLRRFYERAMNKGYPLIIVDGKPDENNIEWLMNLAKKTDRPFYGFNCGNFSHYDCLSNGGYTELKDKIISLKDEWQNDYYRSIAEDYLQTAFDALLRSKSTFDLKRVVECLEYGELAILARASKDAELMRRVASLEQYDRKDITGLQAHLNILINSELGKFFEIDGHETFNLADVLEKNAVVFFALPALQFPSFSKVLGKLVINDLKAVVGKQQGHRKIFTIFDEFSVFAGEQVLNLVNMGRGKGVHAVFGTQGLSDLKRFDPVFANQVLNCVNTILCHRLNDQDSAESISTWIGTRDTFTVTAQLDLHSSGPNMGSVRSNKEFIVHPDSIKQELQPGEAFYVSKVGSFKMDKVVVKYS